MKKVLLAIALYPIMQTASAAADLPVKASPSPVPPVVYDWSGIYVGAGLGGVWSEPHRFYPNLQQVGIPPTTFVSHGTDGLYDFHGGVQWQWGQWILGAEVNYSAGFKDMRSSVSISPPEPFTALNATTRVTQLVTIGPRLGYSWGPFMAYGTVGYAAAHLKGTYTCDDGIPTLPGPGACGAVFGPFQNQNFGGATWNNGWSLGAGFEFMAYRGPIGDLILGADYLHFDVNQKLAFACTIALCGPTTHQNFFQDARGDIVRARLSLKTAGWEFFGFASR
jgi:opacity protein-like surface antigen